MVTSSEVLGKVCPCVALLAASYQPATPTRLVASVAMQPSVTLVSVEVCGPSATSGASLRTACWRVAAGAMGVAGGLVISLAARRRMGTKAGQMRATLGSGTASMKPMKRAARLVTAREAAYVAGEVRRNVEGRHKVAASAGVPTRVCGALAGAGGPLCA